MTSFKPNYLLKAPLLNTIPQGLGFQHMNFGSGGDTNVQSITMSSPEKKRKIKEPRRVDSSWHKRERWRLGEVKIIVERVHQGFLLIQVLSKRSKITC